MEYRNRGIGSRLLHASLEALGGRGVSVASGVTRAKTVAARHVYPKFGGVAESISFSKFVEAKA
jgi:ribosomal protein S18 acetylase RimI-like enzyme